MNCIKCTTEDNKSWCGEELDGSFNFKDTEAAAINGAMKGAIVPCENCVHAIFEHLYIPIEPQKFSLFTDDIIFNKDES